MFRKEIPDIQVFGSIIIDDNCVIGENAILLPNIRIGKNSIVGAWSVVISDIPPDSIAMGVPARVWSAIEKYREKCIEKWKVKKPLDITVEKGATWWNFRHNAVNSTRSPLFLR